MIQGVTADFVAVFQQLLDIVPIKQIHRGHTEAVLADVFQLRAVSLADQRRAYKKAAGGAECIEDLADAQVLLQPVIEAKTNVRLINLPALDSFYCFGIADQAMVAT